MNGNPANCLDDVKPFASYMFDIKFLRDFRSDHAGEVGAVYIYKGILKATNDPVLLAFAESHLQKELKHLAFFETWLPKEFHSALLPIWRIAGFLLGYLPALLGRKWVFITISAVENFVIEHYRLQIVRLKKQYSEFHEVIEILSIFRDDEGEHFMDSKDRTNGRLNIFQRAWQYIIDVGSKNAVLISRFL